MDYRLYLLDANRRIVAAHGFIAERDQLARETGSIVFDACEDAVAGYEVWRGKEIIATDRDRGVPARPRFSELAREWQDTVCLYEEALCESFTIVRRSQKMTETLATFRVTRNERTSPPDGGR